MKISAQIIPEWTLNFRVTFIFSRDRKFQCQRIQQSTKKREKDENDRNEYARRGRVAGGKWRMEIEKFIWERDGMIRKFRVFIPLRGPSEERSAKEQK